MRTESALEGRAWLARIRMTQNGRICGAGLAVDGRHVLTAAHVVLEAGAGGPGSSVFVDFPLLDGSGCQARVLEEGWTPAGSSSGDHAVLLLEVPPEGVVPAAIRAPRSLNGHSFTAYGFPRGYDDSLPAMGRAGKASALEWVTLNVENDVPISPGFSGAAVWSDQCDAVVAMIVTSDRATQGKVGFAVPVAHLAERIPLIARMVQPGPDLESPATRGGTAEPDGQLAILRQAYGQLDELRAQSPSTETSLTLRTVQARLDSAAVKLLRGDRQASGMSVGASLSELARIRDAPTSRQRQAPQAVASSYGSGAILIVKLVDLHAITAVAYRNVVSRVLAAVDELQRSLGRQAAVSMSGATVTVVLGDQHADFGRAVRALFALAFRLHMLVPADSCRIATIVSHGEDLIRLGEDTPLADTVTGSIIAESAAVVEPLSTAAFIISYTALTALRASSSLRTGRGQDCSILVRICGEFVRAADLLSQEAATQLRFDCTMLQPRGDMPRLTHYALRVYAVETGESVIGLLADRAELPQDEHLVVTENSASESRFVSQLVAADRVEIAGITNYRLADMLDRAWAIRVARGLGPWRELRIYYAAEPLIASLCPNTADLGARIHRRNAGAKTMQMLLNSRGHQMALDARVAEVQFALPFIGTRFRSAEEETYQLAFSFPGQPAAERYFFGVDGESQFGRRAAEVFALLWRLSRELFEREVWLSRAGPAAALRLAGLYSAPPADPELRLASALVILHAETAGRQRLLLQERTVFNSRDSAGTLSNLSARVFESDLCALSSSSGLTVSPREDSDEVVTTRVFRGLGINSQSAVPREAFKVAAVRESLGGLGLSVDPGRLVWHSERDLMIGRKRLFFQIFSLELSRGPADEVSLIAARRPYANMRFVDLAEVQRLARETPGRLNTLLSAHLSDTFMPIYNSLHLA